MIQEKEDFKLLCRLLAAAILRLYGAEVEVCVKSLK
jgi:hypothetical protein